MLKSPALKTLPMLAMLLAGCQATGSKIPTIAPGTEPPSCLAWKRITFAYPGDTPETIVQVRANNAARRGYGCK